MSEDLLKVSDLAVDYPSAGTRGPALQGIGFTLKRGETVALVGESGSGKSTLALACMGLLPATATITAGQIIVNGADMTHARPATWSSLRGVVMTMILQNPRAALNPLRRIGDQLIDVLSSHKKLSRRAARVEALALLQAVRMPEPERNIDAYAHQLSGGMCQRALIALAISCSPQVLFADEPTTGLDASTQRAVMDMLAEIVRARGMALVLISHDLALAAQYCQKIMVMRAGQVVEAGNVREVFTRARHDYTSQLLAALPAGIARKEIGFSAQAPGAEPMGTEISPSLLRVENLSKNFDRHSAVSAVSFEVARGQSVGLIGESGAGKTTLSRLVTRLTDPDGGSIFYEDEDIAAIAASRFHHSARRAAIQLVFQDPTDSLNPRFTVFKAIADPLRRLMHLRHAALGERVRALMAQVGLDEALIARLPHQLSGGEKARLGIARALASDPQLLVLDEPTASLDVSIQAMVLALLQRLQRERGLSYLFVSHDLHVVRLMCDHVIIMRAGEIVEQGPADRIFTDPQHDYTKQLLAAMPRLSFADAEQLA